MKKSAGQKTKEKILNAGLELWPNITLQAVSKATDLTHPGILYHFPNGTLKEAIAEYAVETGNSKVIVQLILVEHKAVSGMSPSERDDHFKSV